MQNVVNRLSRLQKDILTFLATVSPPSMETPDEYGRVSLAVLPTTGAVIEAVGRERNPANYAIVSRALVRLVERGLVQAWSGELLTQGKGHHYCLAPPPPETLA